MGPAAVLLIVASVLTWAACDKAPLTAPTGSTITLFVNPAVILTNGTANVTAVVLESSGTPVQNGTLVSFYSNIGAIDPADAQTFNGRVTVKFRAGLQQYARRGGFPHGPR